MKQTLRPLSALTRRFVTAALLFGGACLSFSGAAVTNAEYDQLIFRARAGETGPALALLRQLGERATVSQRFDHILIASWAGESHEVADVYRRLPLTAQAPPANVQLAAARALREQRRWPEALAVWRSGLQQHPSEQAAFVAGYIMTLADAGQALEAISTGQAWLAYFKDNVDLHLALAYADVVAERPFDALYYTDKALQLAPYTPYVQREYIFALQRVGMPEQALAYAQARPGRLQPAQIRALEADIAAIETRMAAVPARNEGERFVLADRALARYDALLYAWRGLGAEAANDVLKLRIDRLSALHARVRMQELVSEYESLIREGVKVPVWALSNVASAYLHLRQPETARDLYRTVLADLDATTPLTDRYKLGPAGARLGNEIGLFYALSEAEQFAELKPLLERIKAYGPVWLYYKGNPKADPNSSYLDAQLMEVTAHMVMDDTPAAHARVQAMVAKAPANTNLRARLAGVYRARAQPRRAEAELKLAETMTPRALVVENEQGMVALDLQEWKQAEQLSSDVIARFPEQQEAQRLARQWNTHNKTEIRVSAAHGLASDSPVAGRSGLGIDTAVYSPPIAYNLRLFGGIGHASSTFQEGSARYTWERAGVEWRSRDLWAEAELSGHHYGNGGKVGARLSAGYDWNDYWRVGGDLEANTRSAPLRALRSGVAADAAGAYVRWRAHERREWQLSASTTRFADGNHRLEYGLSGRERVYSHPHLWADLTLDVSAQGNSQDAERLYYNPKRGLMLLPGITFNHILNRRYENVWEHFLRVSAGAFQQRTYGTDSVYALAYGQRYRYQDVFEAGLTLNAISRPYDGTSEREAQISFDLVSRF